MYFALIGHRGVGKSALLARLTGYYQDAGRVVTTIDLDREIAARAGISIAEIFARHGEEYFRQLERQTLHAIVAALRANTVENDVYIAVGAGYTGELPQELLAVWIRRLTDSAGRIFIDAERPRLDDTISPLDEYKARYARRESGYRKSHREVWTLLEGLDGDTAHCELSQEIERAYFLQAIASEKILIEHEIGGVITLLPNHLRDKKWLQRRLAWLGVRFELRDDLLDENQLEMARSLVPATRRITSFRKRAPDAAARKRVADTGEAWDFPLELFGDAAPQDPTIVSLHERFPDETFSAAAQRLEQAGAQLGAKILKLAVEVRDFDELMTGHKWALRDPKKRAFLPRSPSSHEGRWRWYRLLTGVFSPLAFFREGDGTSFDQPLLAEWWQQAALENFSGRFAAVLGDPIAHSRTPVEHAAFFQLRAEPVVAIRISEAELRNGGLPILRELGLRQAAVTSPLKRCVAELLHARGELDTRVSAVNTIYFNETRQRFFATNTDLDGARALFAPIANTARIAVWGGGGTLQVLRDALPQARYFSSRTGQDRDREMDAAWQPEIVVWASGSARGDWPATQFAPNAVYDLSYGEDSAGREYALRCGARYVSGLAMFHAQAAAQRNFFAEMEALEDRDQIELTRN